MELRRRRDSIFGRPRFRPGCGQGLAAPFLIPRLGRRPWSPGISGMRGRDMWAETRKPLLLLAISGLLLLRTAQRAFC